MPVDIRNQTVQNETIVLRESEHEYLGPDATFRNCLIWIQRKSTRSLLICENTHFVGCEFRCTAYTKNFGSWGNASYIDCSFVGRYMGHNFAQSPPTVLSTGEPYPEMIVENCDFSEASLEGFQTFDVSLDEMTFPKWPGFTIAEPRKNVEDLLASDLPDCLHRELKFDGSAHHTVRSISHNAEKLIEEYCDADHAAHLEQARRAMSGLDYIIM